MKIQDRIKMKTKSNKGITLIALVITIIVLLILAGVTIAALSGDNGILTRAKEAKKKQKVFQIKEVKLRPNIEDHDFFVKLKNAQRFLGDGNKVKVTIMFRGREMSHPELGQEVLDRFAKELGDSIVREKPPKLEGRNMTMVIGPKA